MAHDEKRIGLLRGQRFRASKMEYFTWPMDHVEKRSLLCLTSAFPVGWALVRKLLAASLTDFHANTFTNAKTRA